MVASGMGYLYLYLCLFLCLFPVVLIVVVLVSCGNDVVLSEASFAAAGNDDEVPSSPRVLLFWITTVHAIRRTLTSSSSLETMVPGARFSVRSFDLSRVGPVIRLVVVLAAFLGEDFGVVLCGVFGVLLLPRPRKFIARSL